MAIDKYLDKMDDTLEEALNLPFTGGKRMVDIEKIRDLIDEVRMNLPQEIKDAKAIVADREEIISVARDEAEVIVKRAEERARALVSQEEVLKQAQLRATEVLREVNEKIKSAERATLDFTDSRLKECEESLAMAYNEVKTKRQAIKTKPKTKPNNTSGKR